MLQSNYLISNNKNINSALKKINKNKFKTLLVINKSKQLLGSISEGDIRRGILKYNDLTIKINKIYNKNAIVIQNQSDLKKKGGDFLKKDVDLIPHVKNKKINKIYFNLKNKNDINNFGKLKNISSVIIAGGLGTRLEPYNKIFPKPLMPYKNNSLLNEIIKKFEKYSIENFYILTNYKSNEIKKYASTINSKSKIIIVKEKIRSGTIGGLAYLKNKRMSDNFFVINCDTILNINFEKIYDFHIKKNSDLTVVSSKKYIKLPFGNCEINNNLKLKKNFRKAYIKIFSQHRLLYF